VTDSILDTPPFVNGDNSTILMFRHSYDLENGLDGAVLEISINGGPFVDFVTAGGGGLYNGTISAGSFSPIAGRAAWTGNSGGYVDTFAHMPFQSGTMRLRFRLATGCSGASTGWRIDSVSVASNIGCPSPTPTPTATPSTTPNEPHFEVSAPSIVLPSEPFNITVTAKLFSNVFTGYTGTVHFTSTSASGAHLPPDSTLTNGVGTFSVTFDIPGNYTITARDTVNPSMIGTSGTIFVAVVDPPTPTIGPTVSPSPTVVPTATPTPSLAPPTPTPTPVAAQAVNLSTRMRVQTGDNVGIGGFIITGVLPRAEINIPAGSTSPKHVLIRAIGPSLTGLGVPGALADPVLELHGPGTFSTITNNNWRDDPIQEALIIASGIPPTSNLESAIDATLNPGSYTAVVRGNNDTTGVALVEVYDLNQSVLAKLANISTRAFVDTGDNIVIAGFMLGGGSEGDRVVVRGLGQSLIGLGIPGALANPRLELRDSNAALVRANDDWQDDPGAPDVIAAGLVPENPSDSAIAATLPPGLYTALLSGVNNGTGIGLVEVYDRGAP
jgi:hypothetical protein